MLGKHSKAPEGMLRSFIYIGIFALLVPYYETVFYFSTLQLEDTMFTWGTPIMLLISLAFGLTVFLPLSFVKNRTVNYVTSIVVMALLALPYLIQYFIYKGFKTFYSLADMFAGASDMFSSYGSETAAVIFCWDGIFKIILFALPAALFVVFGRLLYKEDSLHIPIMPRCIAAAAAVLCYALSALLTCTNSTAMYVYKDGYSYSMAVRRFGLLTGLGLDIADLINDRDVDFLDEPELDVPASDVVVPNDYAPEVPIEYGDNVLELDLTSNNKEVQKLNDYVSSLEPSAQNPFTGMFKDKNLILITAEAFTAEVIDPTLTPTLYRLATKGIQFKDFYQPYSAGTTGGEYQNIFGMLPTAGGSSFKNTATHYNYMTMGSQLDRLGYYGKAFHNNSYTYYDRHKTHNNIGYSDGFMGYGNGMEEFVKNRWPQSDLEMFQGTVPTYIDEEKFNVYYMTVSGHSNYTKMGNSMTYRNWDLVKDLPYSDNVKGYLAANMELEKALAYLVEQLEQKGIADDTVICLTTDHYPYGLTDQELEELYGKKITNEFDRTHSALILWSGCLEDKDPIVVTAPTTSLDILPTLSNLFGTEYDSRLFPGRDALSNSEAIAFDSHGNWKTEYGTYLAAQGKFIPSDKELPVDFDQGEYISRTKKVVQNKINYCRGALDNDYFRHLFKE